MKRRLATILVGDVVGYSSLMEADEEGTAARMRACRAITDSEIAQSDGRVFKAMGDSVLAEFSSPINAVRCAAKIRDQLKVSEEVRGTSLTMRFGLHLADVLVEGEDLIGDGVNVAARIQQSAEPGTICLSGTLFDQIRRNSPYACEDLGMQVFRNIAEPVRVYSLRGELGSHRYQLASAVSQPNQVERRPHSIAVMPLETSSGDEDQSFLTEGFSEDLIFELGRFHKLFVTAFSATRLLKHDQTDPKCIGEQLGVRYVLTGSVRQLGSRMRLSLSLTETDIGTVDLSRNCSAPLTAYYAQKENDYGNQTHSRI